MHWGGWRDESRLLFDMDAVLAGEVDVISELRNVPAARVAQMQHAIATHAARIHYTAGEPEPGAAPDALELLLAAIADRADQAELAEEAGGGAARGCADAPRLETPYLPHPLVQALGRESVEAADCAGVNGASSDHPHTTDSPQTPHSSPLPVAGLLRLHGGNCSAQLVPRKSAVMLSHVCPQACGACGTPS